MEKKSIVPSLSSRKSVIGSLQQGMSARVFAALIATTVPSYSSLPPAVPLQETTRQLGDTLYKSHVSPSGPIGEGRNGWNGESYQEPSLPEPPVGTYMDSAEMAAEYCTSSDVRAQLQYCYFSHLSQEYKPDTIASMIEYLDDQSVIQLLESIKIILKQNIDLNSETISLSENSLGSSLENTTTQLLHLVQILQIMVERQSSFVGLTPDDMQAHDADRASLISLYPKLENIIPIINKTEMRGTLD